MPRVGLEPTIPMFERTNTFCDLDRAATVIGGKLYLYIYVGFEVLRAVVIKSSIV
jgi:hypothetical protein